MKVTFCLNNPKRFICLREEKVIPLRGSYIILEEARYIIERVERFSNEYVAYVRLDVGVAS